MIHQTRISKEDMEDYLDSQFEGRYQPVVTDMKIKKGILIIEYELE